MKNSEYNVRKRRIGEVSSKYGLQPELFEKDIAEHYKAHEELYQSFKTWMIENKADPEKLRYMFVRLYEEFLQR